MLQQGLQNDTPLCERYESAVHQPDNQLQPDSAECLAELKARLYSQIYSESKGQWVGIPCVSAAQVLLGEAPANWPGTWPGPHSLHLGPALISGAGHAMGSQPAQNRGA